MNHALALSAAVCALVALALLLAWRRDRSLVFARDLGLAFACQALAPLGFWLWFEAEGARRLAGVALLMATGAGYLGLLVLGCARLAGRAPTLRQSIALVAGLLLLLSTLVMVSVRFPPLLGALVHAGAGLLVARWLPRRGAERFVGPLLVGIGGAQLIAVIGGPELAALQASVAAVLRLALGLSLIHAALQRSAAEAARAQQRFANLTERSHQGVGVQRGEQVLYMNPAARRIYGLDGQAAPPPRWREATIPEEQRAAARERHRALMAGEIDQADWEADRQRLDGGWARLRFSSWRIDWDGEPAEQVVVTDITAEHNALRDRLHQATHDALTGLPNRSALLQRLQALTPAGRPFVLMVLDIDRFALINDAYAPSVGDEVLCELARGLARRFAGQAELMRLGEDEFALLAEGTSERVPALVAGVRQVLASPVPAGGQAFYLDVSMGLALHPDTAADPERLLRAANAAMHEAKRVPGISAQVAEERFERGSGASLAAEQALRHGLDGDEFHLVFQPKFGAADRALLGFEALLRWRRGETLVAPGEFIPAAERTGLIGPLGRRVLGLACRQIAAWRNAGLATVPVAVNVSRWQLADPGFAPMVLELLQAHGLAPQALTLEITETALMQDFEAARGTLEALRAAGVPLSLDDFGEGLSSLSALRLLPLAEVKIDRGLVAPLPATDATAVIAAVCSLARALGVRVVGEGVENEAQAAALWACGCDSLQGFLLGRPETADLAGQRLQARRGASAA